MARYVIHVARQAAIVLLFVMTALLVPAVIKLGPGRRFEFNYDYCKGCGLCVSECPCGAIRMEPEAA